nr:hypothetical protein [Desulfobacterales bacterium]
MDLHNLFERYKLLVKKADHAFLIMKRDYGDFIRCRIHCSDCCHAIFGLFLIEAAYIKHHFSQLNRNEKREAILRAERSDKDLLEIEERLKVYENNQRMRVFALSKERVRCPLLDQNQECILYPFRPITCRVYGIPTAIHGKGRVCSMAAFKKGETYPTFDMDATYRELYHLSNELLMQTGCEDMNVASLLISVSKAIRMPMEDIIRGNLE